MDGRNLSIKIPGFGEAVMELIGFCDCNCSANPVSSHALYYHCIYHTHIQEINSTFCNDRNGSLVCGQCVCNEGW